MLCLSLPYIHVCSTPLITTEATESLRFTNKNSACISHLQHACYMCYSSHPPCLNQPNNFRWTVQAWNFSLYILSMFKMTLTNSKSPSTKALWNLAWFSWWCLAWKGSAVGGWWSGPPPPAPEIWFNCRCRRFWNLCRSSAESCGDCWGDGVVVLCCWGCTELALCCDGDMLALGNAVEWALLGTSPPGSLCEGETWGWPLPWNKKSEMQIQGFLTSALTHPGCKIMWIPTPFIPHYIITPTCLKPHYENVQVSVLAI